MTAKQPALADLAAAQDRLTRLLLAETPDGAAIAAAADLVRRAERVAAQAEQGR